MKALPYDSFEIETPLSVGQVIASLNSQIESTKSFLLWGGHTTFQGTVSKDGFEITRIIHYRNSFLPIIRGKFRLAASGTTIAIKMGMQPFVIAFMSFWFAGVGLAILAVPAAVFSGQTKWDPLLLIPFGMLLFGWTLVSAGFWFEANKTKTILLKMFGGRERDKQAADCGA